MAQKIIFGTINAESMKKISGYHQAYVELKNLKEWYKTESGKISDKIFKLLEDRKKAEEQGMLHDEAISKYDRSSLDNEQRALEVKYEDKCKPHKEIIKNAMTLIPDSIYYGYCVAMNKGDCSATGKITLKKGKNTEEHEVKTSFKTACYEFAITIGLGNAENDTAMRKFADIMKTRAGGVRKCNKGDDFITLKSSSQFKELFMLCFLQYVIHEKKVVVINGDNTLSMREYDAE